MKEISNQRKNSLRQMGMDRWFNIVAAMLLCVVATCSFSACEKDKEAPDVPSDPSYAPSRTVLVYMVAENSLNGQVSSDISEMLNGMRDSTFYPNDRLVIYLDDIGLPRTYVVERYTKERTLSDLTPSKTWSEDVNSSSPQQLSEVLEYTKSMCGASSYGLVMWSHASGWIPSSYGEDRLAPRRTFGLDNGRNSSSSSLDGNQMAIEDLARVVEDFGGVDFIFFDACFMQSVEVAYTLRNAAKYIIASPAEIPGPGANYQTMVKAMMKMDDYADKILTAYYDQYGSEGDNYGIVISSVKTTALSHFAAYMKTVVANHREDLLNANYENVQDYFRYDVWASVYPDFYDMKGVMKQVLSDEEMVQWEEEAAKVVNLKTSYTWYSAFNRLLNGIDKEQCCGVSMFVPLDKYAGSSNRFDEEYLDTEWAQDVWVE